MKLLSCILTPIWGVIFFLLLGIFHPIQWVCLKLFGYVAHKKSVELLNLGIMKSLLILGHRVKHIGKAVYPKGRTIIFVSNHQSMFDIPPMIWHLRKSHPKFVAKKELGKGIPSISFNLRNGGSVLIDRKDKSSAMQRLERFSNRIKNNKWSAIIFPEGTRSRDKDQKKFSLGGLAKLLETNPKALIVPITIKDSWKITRYAKFPMGLGAKVTMTTHKAMEIGSQTIEEFIEAIEEIVKNNGTELAPN